MIHPSSTRATIHTIKVAAGLILKSAAAKAELPVTDSHIEAGCTESKSTYSSALRSKNNGTYSYRDGEKSDG